MNTPASASGFLFGLAAYTLWGVFPLFFTLLRDIPSSEVLLHRVLWSFVLTLMILFAIGWHARFVATLRNPTLLIGLTISSLLVSSNWLIYIWAVAQGRVLESSLGYFITPLVSVFLARLFLSEKMNRWQVAAVACAGLGVLWLLIRLGYLPWVSLALALTFGLYGLARKRLEVDTVTGLSVETALLTPLALAYWVYLDAQGSAHFLSGDNRITLLLLACGIVTTVPLLFFASATRRLSLTVVGFMMYVNPTLQFLIALWVLHEPLSTDLLAGFCFIWVALLLFSYGSMPRQGT